MKLIFRFFLCTLLLVNAAAAQVLIKHVNVLDVINKKLLLDYDVLALDGHIVSVEKGRSYKLPGGTEVIDGTGKYLIPGLVDAHVHFFQSGGIYARPDAIDLRKTRPYSAEIDWSHAHMEQFLRLYARAGITSVIDVGASNNFLHQRDTFAGKPYAPTVTMTGPLLTTYIPPPYKDLGDNAPFVLMHTEDSVRLSVNQQIAQHADFIKIWYIVLDKELEKGARKNLPLVKAAIDEAHKHGLRVAVHATEQITARLAVEAGADYLVHNVEDELLDPSFIALLKKNKVVLCPTLVVAGNYQTALGHTYQFDRHELSVDDPFMVASIIDYPQPDTAMGGRLIRLLNLPGRVTRERRMDSIMTVNVKRLLDGGVILATGSDAGNLGTQHVGSFFKELEAMEKAGFNRWQLLQSSTINAAIAAGKQNKTGSISKGKEADMVLLNANPLDSLGNWSAINRVILRGRAMQPDSLLVFSPVELVQQQLNAFNAHDVEAFLDPYSEDVEIYNYPDKLQSKGKDKMRGSYQFLKTNPKIYCKLVNRIVQGNLVIDHEEIQGIPGAPYYGVAIYEVSNGKIVKVVFME